VRGTDLLRRGLVPSLLLAAASLPAQSLRLTAPEAGNRLLPGSVIEASWDSEATLEGTDEGELVLSLDGGRSFPVRVTAEIEPGDRRAEWRVPALPTAHARLAIRFGREGELDAERIANVSAEFEILADAAAPEERFFWIGGEWRTREALAPRARGILLTALLPPTALASHRETEDFVDAPRPSPLLSPVLHRAQIPSRTGDRLPAAPDALPDIGRPTSPLRI
jgi:hypothetical protein